MPIILKGATSGQVTLDTPAVAGTNTITLPASTGTMQLLSLATAQNTTSGTSIDFTSIPSWAKKITVMCNGVSTNGTSPSLIQIGTASGIEITGYLSYYTVGATAGGSTAGFIFGANQAAANSYSGHITLTFIGSNLWVTSSIYIGSLSAVGTIQAGSKTTAGVLDRLRLTTVNGTDTFDAGSVNILIEGN